MPDANISAPKIQTKQHFQILDGLRGVAAISVVIFHFMEVAVPKYPESFIAHAYLSVDFFFCLSGFVIAYAYDEKLKGIGLWNFFKLRLIRLHPLVIIGSVIGLLAFAFDPLTDLFTKYSGNSLLMFLASCFMVPYPLVHERYFNLFHLNPPTWSLFWEYIANVVYAFILVKIPNKVLWILVAVAAVLLAMEAHRSGFLGVGWGGDNVAGGAYRVFYSFLAGILAYRSKWIIKSRIGFLPFAALLLLIFMIPFNEKTNPFVDPFIAIFIFPVLVALGAGATLRNGLRPLCKFSGDISYPLYMIHYPIIWLFQSYVEAKKPMHNEMMLIMAISTIILIIMAWLILVYIDEPIRKYLKRKWIVQ
ncbi:acyltransferase family protein [Mucilaginibacter pedocola]|uniref:Acyltransferase n=1 Tax=Mucilaginibacter pedocola TaxID=1792845 RepID=A0A1S9PMF6_9SPHI|nr:acyltransferase [Mucilaginibacter pedocola]OOQ62107.1 acyltransferase [Mucilaginibacter pedocola]